MGRCETMKPCTKCTLAKPLCEFRRSNRTKDGLDTQCRSCRAAKAKTAEARNTPSTRANWARGTMANLHLTERDYS
jgi:hypothetical protein